MRRVTVMMGTLLVLGLVVLPTSALTLTSDLSYEFDDALTGAHSGQDGPRTASAGYLNPFLGYSSTPSSATNSAQLRAVATASGNLSSESRIRTGSNSNSMEFHSQASWSNTFTNTTAGALDYHLNYSSSGGLLNISNIGGSTGFRLNVLVDGVSIWSRTATLSGDPNGGGALIETAGLSHQTSRSGTYVQVLFTRFSGALDLGTVASGEDLELTYIIESWGSESGTSSAVEANVGQSPGTGFVGQVRTSPSATPPVPEPTTMALLGMGIAGLGARRLCRKN